MQDFEFERFAGAAPDDGGRTGVCFYGLRSRKRKIRGGGAESGQAKSKIGVGRASESGAGSTVDEICCAANEIHRVHARSRSVGADARMATEFIAESEFGFGPEPVHGGPRESGSRSFAATIASAAMGAGPSI